MNRRIFKTIRTRLVNAAEVVARSRNFAFAIALFGTTFVVVDALLLPRDSRVGSLLRSAPTARISGCIQGWAIESDGEIRIAVRHPDRGTPVLAEVYCEYEPRRTGLWAITRAKYDASVAMVASNRIAVETQARIRAALADHLVGEASVYPPYLEWLRQGRNKVERIVWVGHVHNLITAIVAAVVLGIMFLGVVRVFENRRVRIAIQAGRCAWCGYDLRGNLSDVCTECGKPVRPKEMAA